MFGTGQQGSTKHYTLQLTVKPYSSQHSAQRSPFCVSFTPHPAVQQQALYNSCRLPDMKKGY